MTKLPKSKILDMEDLKDPVFQAINSIFDGYFDQNWPQVPLRRWEYVAAIVFSEVMSKPGLCLDAGSGFTVFPQFLYNIGCEVHCVDIGVRINGIRNGIQYHKASMLELPFGNNYFSYVFAISSIEHVNAGKFKIEGMEFDTGDTQAMQELVRVLNPGGILILTTDYADKYYPPPGLWPSGSHRIYDSQAIYDRLYYDVKDNLECLPSLTEFEIEDKIYDWSKIKEVEPKGYDYTEAILTFRKC